MKLITRKFVFWVFLYLPLALQAQLTADFSATPVSGCSPLVVSFTDLSTGNPTGWLWDFGNGNTSSQQNPGAIYVQPGVYTITLIVFNGTASDTLVRTAYIQVYNDPVADLSVSSTAGCVPFTVQFTDQSIPTDGAINAWLWDFGDGTTSSLQNPTHTYTTTGTFSVSLVVTDIHGCGDDTVYSNLITVSNYPVAGFTMSGNFSCTTPYTVTFTNTSTGNIVGYNWDFGDGATSTAMSPAHTFTSYGTFQVTLVVSNVLGCTDSFTQTVEIQNFVADFSVNQTNICAGDAVTFTDLSGPNPVSWNWFFGDGGQSNQPNPTHVYTTAGDYTVTLVSVSDSGCNDTKGYYQLIHVDSTPVISFSTLDTFSCSLPYTVQFTNQTVNGSNWFWDFGDGGTSNAQNPVHTYTTEGIFNVSLTATSPNGCPANATVPALVVIDVPKANFYAWPVNHGCIPFTVTFQDSSQSTDPIVSWQWDLGDGTTSTAQNPVHTYTSPGTYTISLVITTASGCTDTLVRPAYIQVGTLPVPAFTWSPDTQCVNQWVNFFDASTNNTQWYWNFGDGETDTAQNPVHAYSDTGTYTVTLTVSNMGCDSTLIVPNAITIVGPIADFSYQIDCNNPYTVLFNDLSSSNVDSWTWYFGDGDSSFQQNPLHTFPATGSYTVTLTVFDSLTGCPNTISRVVTIADLQAAFSALPTSGCTSMQVVFSDQSTDAVSWLWDFGDGTTSIMDTVVHTYYTAGIYTVSLVVTDVNGCKDSISMPNLIHVSSVSAGFTAPVRSGCVPFTVNFQDTSISSTGTVNSWTWNFGDGTTSTAQHPVHTYTVPGLHTVSLTVTDNVGCSNTTVQNAYIYAASPQAYFYVDSFACADDPVWFVDSSSGGGLQYLWDFGDGLTDTVQNPVHFYHSYGTYTVSLTVTDSVGCVSVYTLPNAISIEKPVAGFSATPTVASCPPLTVYFTDTSQGNITSWFWDFGDGTTSILQNPSHTYTNPGSYSVSLVVTTNNSCRDTLVIDSLINILGPTGTFTAVPDKGCIPLTVTLIANSQNTISYTWDFGDGSVVTSTSNTITHTYIDTGYRYPILILDDGLGCTHAIVADTPIIADQVSVDFVASTTELCQQGLVYFGSIVQSLAPPASWLWDFGDSTTSTLQNPVHFYSTPGFYTVSLIVESSGGCADTMIKPQFIHVTGLQAAFSNDTMGCGLPFDASFFDQSTTNDTIIAYSWTFGDGGSDNLPNPVHTYTSGGVYPVFLVVQTPTGCADTAMKTVIIGDKPVASFSGTDICLNDTAVFIDNSSIASGNIAAWSWDFGDSQIAVGQQVSHVYQTDSIYLVRLVVYSDMGCTDTAWQPLIVHPLPDPMASGDTAICLGQSATLGAINGISYQWLPNYALSDPMVANPVATPAVTTQYTVLATDSNGCSNTDSVLVTVKGLPVVTVSPDLTLCLGDSVQLLASGGNAYQWFPSQGLDCPTCPDPKASPAQSTVYSVLVTNAQGCSSGDSVLVTVLPLPAVDLGNDTLICQGDTITLQSNSNGAAYQWDPPVGLTCPTCPVTGAFPKNPTQYLFSVTDNNGCTAHDSIFVDVSPVPVATVSGDVSICKGEQIQLVAGGGLYYNWQPAAGLSCTQCPDPFASPQSSTTYQVQVANDHCSATQSIFVEVKDKVTAMAWPDTAICAGDQVTLHSTADSTTTGSPSFEWAPAASLSNPNIPDPVATPDVSTQYTVTVTNGTCQPAQEIVQVTVHDNPAVDAGKDQLIFSGMSALLDASVSGNGPFDYQWQPPDGLSCSGCEDPQASPDTTTVYLLTVTDANRCKRSDTVTVRVIDACAEALIYVPNTFTPNGDGRNDRLYVRAYGIQQINYFRVFDRWGKLLFETKDISHGWDGTYLGTPLDPAVFVYEVEGICLNGDRFVKTGNVAIIR